jgi:hypothetical protein
MSASLIPHTHLHALVSAGINLDCWPATEATEYGQALQAANLDNLAHVYDCTETADPYDHSAMSNQVGAHPQGELDPVRLLKAIHVYCYQCADHPTWPNSFAHEICADLSRAAVVALPGYDELDWAPVTVGQLYR